MNSNHIIPVAVDESELSIYRSIDSSDFRWLRTLVQIAPRGKGWLPRAIGRSLLKNMRAAIRMNNGVVHAVDPSNLDAYISQYESSGGTVTETCLKLLSAGQCFYDIGANVGIVSLAVSQGLGDRVNVIAFEPQTKLARKIALSAVLNGFSHVTVYDVAVSETNGAVDLFVPDASTHASLASPNTNSKRMKCRTICLDEQVQKGLLPSPQVVKIDVEGAESLVLHGMKSIISSTSPALVFEADSNMVRFGTNHRTIFEFLTSLAGYEFYSLHPDFRRSDRLAAVNLTKPESGNYLALPIGNSALKDRLQFS